MDVLSRSGARRTSGDVTADLFDEKLSMSRRDRAARRGPILFVHQRAFDDILERLGEVSRRFTSALLIGVADPSWPERLGEFAEQVETIDARSDFPSSSDFAAATFDLCVVIGTLDAVNDLPGAMRSLRRWLKPDGLLIGAMPGGHTLPQLRGAMRAADIAAGAASPHVHPRIEASALGHLLTAAGFVMPVVDIDRVRVSYASLAQLVADLRGMGVTNVLRARSRLISRIGQAAAEAHFRSAGQNGRTVETFEILHFAGWTAIHG